MLSWHLEIESVETESWFGSLDVMKSLMEKQLFNRRFLACHSFFNKFKVVELDCGAEAEYFVVCRFFIFSLAIVGNRNIVNSVCIFRVGKIKSRLWLSL